MSQERSERADDSTAVPAGVRDRVRFRVRTVCQFSCGAASAVRGAPCSRILKRELLGAISEHGDVNVIGFTREESDRFDDLRDHFPGIIYEAPLIERDLSHDDCLAICSDAGLLLPLMYRMGYGNANCIGCPKGGQAYWQKIRKDFPLRFAKILSIQEEIGPGAYFLRFRSGPRKGERMGLKDLPAGDGNMANEPSFSCSFFCDQVERELQIT